MKHFRAFTAVALLYTTGLFAQSTGYTYNSHINRAELYIVDGNYKKALSTFEEAFTASKTEFAVDLYNTCVCAVKLNNKAKLLLSFAATIHLTSEVFGPTGDWIFNISKGGLYRINEIPELEKFNYYRNFYCLESLADYEKKLVYRYGTLSDFDFKYHIISGPILDADFFNSNFHEIAVIK